MEGGEWSNFSKGVCVNEEADFMAQLFPNSNNYHHHQSHQNQQSSFYSSESSSSNGYRNPHVVGYYQMEYQQEHQQSNKAAALPIDFLKCRVENEDNGVKSGSGVGPDGHLDESSPVDDGDGEKSSDSSENLKKGAKAFDVPNGTRNVKARKNDPKLKLDNGDGARDDVETEAEFNNSLRDSVDDDCSSKGTTNILNSNGKTRASRGSATDPQSLYARKRRERINERLKILQTLVPNGTKVDISTMLEEAVHYVKFLQLQIKLLSSDEMWMYAPAPAPIAYNGMNLGLDFNNINIPK